MDVGVMAGRMQMARERIEEKAKVLAAMTGVPEPEWRGNADPEVATLWRMEAIGDLLASLVAAIAMATAPKVRSKKPGKVDAAGPHEPADESANAGVET